MRIVARHIAIAEFTESSVPAVGRADEPFNSDYAVASALTGRVN
jgi:hypothetical protein